MAIVNINYDCGCGFHGKTVEEAIKHVDVDKPGHTLNVAGIVKSSERKVHGATSSLYASPRPSYRKSAVAPLEMQAEDRVDFGRLRARLQKK